MCLRGAEIIPWYIACSLDFDYYILKSLQFSFQFCKGQCDKGNMRRLYGAYLALSQHRRWMNAVHAPVFTENAIVFLVSLTHWVLRAKMVEFVDSVDPEESAHILSRLA